MDPEDRIELGINKNEAGKWKLPNDQELHHGHKPGYEEWRINRVASDLNIDKPMTQAELNNFVNSKPNYFHMETKADNLSHKFENKNPYGAGEEKEIRKAMQTYLLEARK